MTAARPRGHDTFPHIWAYVHDQRCNQHKSEMKWG